MVLVRMRSALPDVKEMWTTLVRKIKTSQSFLSGLRPEFQNANGVVCFARDMLSVFMDQNEFADIIKLGMNRQGLTVTKVVFYSVGSCLRLYQAWTAPRGNRAGVFVNEDLT